MKYGDVVVLVQKGGDGTVRRTNAIVMSAATHVPLGLDRKVLEGAEAQEHVDLAFPAPSLSPDGQGPKTRNMDEIFRPAWDVRPWVEGLWVGYEVVASEQTDTVNTELETQTGAFGELTEAGKRWEELQRLAAAAATNQFLKEYPLGSEEQKQCAPSGPEEEPALSLEVETKVYADGTTATGVGPLPDHSPEEQALLKSSGDNQVAGDWTAAGQDASGFPVAKGSAEDVTS